MLPARPKTAALDILREHWKRGRAAGNVGDLYDNRDRGHSALKPGDFPQLAHVAYSPEARAAELDYGLQDKLLFDRPTFGNSSTAVTGGVLWRSLPRLAMTQADGTGPLRLWQNAEANALYVYPAHKDWTPETGDLFPANTPYILVSHGSSGSDQPFLEALALTYAAFRPDTKARLTQEHLLVPTVQMIFRRSLQHVTSREGYFSGDAHPAAFEGYTINPARMVSLAQSIEPDAIPPEVRIAVTAEELGLEGVDYFGEGLSEQLFDTPGAIARIWRSKAATRTMTVSAAETRDPNGRPLDFHWRLLQGDPERVTIEPLRGRHQRDDHPRLARPLRHLRGQPRDHVPRRHRRLRLERRPRQRPGDPLLVLPPEREAPHRARPRRRPAHRRHRPRQPRPRLRRPDPRPPRRLARRLRLRRRRHPPRLDAGARRTRARPPNPSMPKAGACPTRETPPPP